ncbi:MarR family transcriptional regulator [bacterium]|nr:MarR family transcriptional regulator [bacterium]
MSKNKDDIKREFIEDMARTCEQTFGLPRMGGRIWGVLLTTEKEQLSSEELMEEVHASRGSVSTMVRMLERVGFIKRVTVRGDRRHFYSASGAESLLHAELASIKLFIQLMERGKQVMNPKDKKGVARLEEIRALMMFFESEYKGLLNRWHQKKDKK